MKKTITLFSLLASNFLQAQIYTSGFENLTLQTGTAYQPQTSTPFYAAGCKFEYTWDTQFSFWSGGFSYTNHLDSAITTSVTNLHGVRAYKGYHNSPMWVVAQDKAVLTPTVTNARINGFYITNTTYAYKSMKKGDQFAKKFGGTSGNDADYFKLAIKGYKGAVASDSVEVYLADFRFANNSQDFILNTWQYVDLSPLGKVDSVKFLLRSSDNSGGFMNTPAFFAMDSITLVAPHNVGINENQKLSTDIIYPNPATGSFFVRNAAAENVKVTVMDLSGKAILETESALALIEVPLDAVATGMYFVNISARNHSNTIKLIRN